MVKAMSSLLTDIEKFIAAHGMTESGFGRAAAKDWKLVQQLRGTPERKPRRLWPETEHRIRQFMLLYPNHERIDA